MGGLFWLIWIWTALGWAHPMSSELHGHQVQVYLEGHQVELRYAAEIPTPIYLRQLRSDPGFQAGSDNAQAGFDRELLRDLEWGLTVLANGERLDWERVEPVGPTRKVDSNFAVYQLWLRAPLPDGARSLNVVNGNIPDEPAYFSSVVFAAPEISIEGLSLLDVDQGKVIQSRSGTWLLEEQQRELRLAFAVDPGLVVENPEFREVKALGTASGDLASENTPLDVVSGVETDPLLSMVTGELSFQVVLLAIGLAIVLGAAHALAPGHGKSLVAAYLLGSRRKVRHAVWLGIIVTITHTAGVYVLALVAWLAQESFPPAQIMPWLELASGVLVLGLGLTLVRGRYKALPDRSCGHEHGPSHSTHGHSHTHEHREHEHSDSEHHHHHHDHGELDDESHAAFHAKQMEEASKGWKELVTMGIAGGLTPCPSALVLLLAAISFHRLAFGLVLVAFFSLGLSLVVMAVGIVVIKLGDRFTGGGRLQMWVPAIALGSAVVVTLFGAWMSWKGAIEVIY